MRKAPFRRKALAVALCCVTFCTACSTAWVSTLDSILAAAAPALIDILEIVSVANGQPVNGNLAAKINADATAIKTLAADFAKVSAGSAPGVCQQLQAAVSAYQADQQLVLQVAQVSDSNTQTKITLLAGLVAGTVNAITAVIPSCQSGATTQKHQGRAALQRLHLQGSLQQHSCGEDWQRNRGCGDPETETPWALEIRALGDSRTAPVTTPNRKFGALRDVHDARDRMYRASRPARPVPQHVDLRPWSGPTKDQGEEGSCTGHAFSSAREWIARKYENGSPILSPQCLYVEELLADGSFPKDDGAMPRTGCQVLAAKGCCETALYPYVAGRFTAPTAEQAQNALKYRTGAYHRIGTLPDFLSCLADATPWPVTVGFTVYESFMSQQVADTGIMPVPKPGEEQQGGHEVLCLGYDFPKQLALIQNSWGDGWGQRGCFWMPFDVIASPDTDLWMVHTGGPWK